MIEGLIGVAKDVLGGVWARLTWRGSALRERRLEAALGVLEALDRVEGAFHGAREQHSITISGVGIKVGSRGEYEARSLKQQEAHGVRLQRLRDAIEGLRGHEARASALWGREAKVPLAGVYALAGTIENTSVLFWSEVIRTSKAIDRGNQIGHPPASRTVDAGLTKAVFGHPGDEIGAAFSTVMGVAVAWYEGRAGMKSRRVRSS